MTRRLERAGRPLSHRAGGPVEVGCQRGTGLISTAVGVTAFLGFLFLAVQLLFNLYATSVVTADGYDAARQVAASQAVGGSSTAQAEAKARARLGSYQSRVHLDWSGTNDEVVRLRIRADNPHLLGFGVTDLAFTHIDRTIEVRVERFR